MTNDAPASPCTTLSWTLPAIRRRSAVDASTAWRSSRSLECCAARSRRTSVQTSGSWHSWSRTTLPTMIGANDRSTSPRRSVSWE